MARKKENHLPSAYLGEPLAHHSGDLDAGIVERLAEIGLNDAEQVVAVAAIDDVRDHLLEFLDVSKQDFEAFVKDLRKALPESIAAELASPDPYEYGLGAMEPAPEMAAEAAALSEEFLPPVAALPAGVNLIAKMPPIRNQASRGTCVAYTLTAIHDYATRISSSQANNFSEQHLYYETKLVDGSPTGCGTWQLKAAGALAASGQCVESIWPYNPNPPCNNHGARPANARSNGLRFRFKLTGLVDQASRNVTWIKTALAAKKPVGISIPVYNSWYSSAQVRKTGALNTRIGNEPSVGGHAVCLVGYQNSSAAPGGGYFILRNSWGTTWANLSPYGAGYGTIPYKYIIDDNWEAFQPVSIAADEETGDDEERQDDVKPDRPERTITIRLKGNVNLIIE